MQAIIKSKSTIEALQELGKKFKTEVKVECEEASLLLPKKTGSGYITGIDFQDGLKLIIFDCCFFKRTLIKYQNRRPNPMRFLFCLSGQFSHEFQHNKLQYQLDSMHSSISVSNATTEQCFDFPENGTVKFISLEIQREEFIKNEDCDVDNFPGVLSKVFKNQNKEDPFLYQNNYSLAIAEIINDIFNAQHTGLVRKSFLQSKALEIFSLQLQQYKDDQINRKKRVLLRKSDIDLIIAAKEAITQNLQSPHTIKSLAKKVGINEHKLKKGFKLIFETTINKYIRDQRLEYAKLLLLDGTLLTNEVAEKIGFSSKSYFSKIFKEKYGVLPKDFVKKIAIDVIDEE